MKNTLLLGLALGIGLSAAAQVPYAPQQKKVAQVPSAFANVSAPYKKNEIYKDGPDFLGFDKYAQQSKIVTAQNHNWNGSVQGYTLKILDTTYYDLQTNTAVGNRLTYNKGDNALAAVWTLGPVAAHPGFPTRGTGYSYGLNKGSGTWSVSVQREENDRTGWPSIMITSQGKELNVAHNTNVSNLHLIDRLTAGGGSWNQSTATLASTATGGNLWARAVVGGTNGQSIHMISLTAPVANSGAIYKGQDGALLYSRSLDQGATWPILHKDFTGLIDSSGYLGWGGDNYAIDSKGDTIAIALGGFDVDVVLLKSVDNGTTWTKTVIDTFPIKKYDSVTMTTDYDNDGTPDTINSNDGSMAVLIDNNGKCHVWWGAMRVLCTNPGSGSNQGLSYFPYTDGLYYWNEVTQGTPTMIASCMDVNPANGQIDIPSGGVPFSIGSYFKSLSSFPNAAIDASGKLFLSYASLAEGTDDGNSKCYRHTFLMRSDDGGATWMQAKDIVDSTWQGSGSSGLFLEGVYCDLLRDADNNVHLTYQRDSYAGHSLSGATPGDTDPSNKNNISEICYLQVPINYLFVGVNEKENDLAKYVSVYPNPASSYTSVSIQIAKPEKVMVNVYDVVGKEVSSFNNELTIAGTHTLNINTDKLSSGVYFVKTTVGAQSVTNKLIIE